MKKTEKDPQGPQKTSKKFFFEKTEKDPQDPPIAPQNLKKKIFLKKTKKIPKIFFILKRSPKTPPGPKKTYEIFLRTQKDVVASILTL